MDKSKYFLNLSKCSEEQVRILEQVTNENIIQISEFPLLFWNGIEWDQVKKGDKLNIKGKTELTYPEFIKLFEGGEDYPGKRYQPLFDHLNIEHGLILHESEMDEIIRIVGGLNSNQ